jgi:hypothetical protein
MRILLAAVLSTTVLMPGTGSAQTEIPGAVADRPLSWSFQRRWAIGGAEDEALLFTAVFRQDLATDQNGRLYVVDRAAHRIAVYDSTGRLVRPFGRQGMGPGELTAPLWVDVRSNGRILVGDAEKNSVVVFAPDGTPEPEFRMTPFLRNPRTLAGGGMVGVASRGRDSLALLLTSEGTPATLASMAASQTRRTPPVCGITGYTVGPIFAPSLLWTARGNRIVASTGAFRLTVFEGRAPQRVLTRQTTPRRSSPALARTHLGEGETFQVFGKPPCTVPTDMILSVAEVAPTIPAYSALAIAPDGRIWATRYTLRGEPGVADIFHAERGYEGSVRLGSVRPAAFLSNGLLVSIERDEDDVPIIVTYRVTR